MISKIISGLVRIDWRAYNKREIAAPFVLRLTLLSTHLISTRTPPTIMNWTARTRIRPTGPKTFSGEKYYCNCEIIVSLEERTRHVTVMGREGVLVGGLSHPAVQAVYAPVNVYNLYWINNKNYQI